MYFTVVLCWLASLAVELPSIAIGKSGETSFTASTPADAAVRNFLGISAGDSIDFIRWNLRLVDNKTFQVDCRYGISRPNTNGFLAEKKTAFEGIVETVSGQLKLKHDSRQLSLAIVNDNILHILNGDGSMMIGNGGWSYALNAVSKNPLAELKVDAVDIDFRDSLIFIGRTPCRGVEELTESKSRAECYKKKWKLSMYKTKPGAMSGTYKLGTVNPRTGKWLLQKDPQNRTIYKLDLNNGNTLDLLQTDKNIIYLMDAKGGLMVGDHDFSYCLNRENK